MYKLTICMWPLAPLSPTRLIALHAEGLPDISLSMSLCYSTKYRSRIVEWLFFMMLTRSGGYNESNNDECLSA